MEKKRTIRKRLYRMAGAAVVILALGWHYLLEPWGSYRKISEAEAALRTGAVAAAQQYLGYQESDGSHQEILDLYNSHEPLAQGYVVQPTDSWCATYVSAVAISQGLTDIIPTECSCQRQIDLWQELGRWQELDSYVPLPGDLIYYDWNEKKPGDCTGWADHVGMVVGTKWPFLKVIEGNKDDMVSYRVILVDDIHIRGFGLPDYASKIK